MTEPLSTPSHREVSMSSASGLRLSVVCGLTVAIVALATIAVPAQTRFKLDTNKYTPEQDVKLGQEAAAQVSKELPMLNDGRTEEWAEQVGRVLVAAIPGEFGHPQFRYTFDVVNQKEITVPANWQPTAGNGGVITYAPDGGFFHGNNGQTAFTHGIQVGVIQNGSGDLRRDTDDLLQGFARSNPKLQQQDGYRRDSLGGRTGLTTVLSNVSDATGQTEAVTVSTTQMRGNSVLFLIGVAPQSEAATYANAFRRVRQSLQISDR